MSNETQELSGVVEKPERTRVAKVYTPAVDIVEKAGEIVLTADMPGVDEGSVEVTLQDNVLTIYGTVGHMAPDGYTLSYAEYKVGDYERSFTLSEQIQKDKIEAKLQNGVLNLVLPKVDEVKTRKIEIKTAA
ncbi:Hsp20/alpha crystallin family protein [Candidatus Magnetomonas plexicatena]|uniref:Hsp20/alpha crystallin family protein n=1 Tax=Candidatus Magnetomonas plexicatena TaxID=2552947 RepID=UPI00110353D9|nr:Hsp20/alpha crystallin family protein [Nitrospirales bacterium LBB_01]